MAFRKGGSCFLRLPSCAFCCSPRKSRTMTSPLLQHGVKAEITKNSLLTPPAQEWFAELHIGLLSIAVPAGGAQ